MAFEPAANLDDLEVGETYLADLSEPVCLVRISEDQVRAVHNVCSHQQQPLHEGLVDEDEGTLTCAAHASCFDLSTGESTGVPQVDPIPVYACKVEDGTVLVDLDQQLNDARPA